MLYGPGVSEKDRPLRRLRAWRNGCIGWMTPLEIPTAHNGETRLKAAPTSSPGRIVATPVQTLANLLRRSAAATYGRELGLSSMEWRVISQLGESPDQTLNELAAAMTHDAGQLSRVVTRLAQAGLLERSSWAGRRGAFIRLSAAGQETLRRLRQFSAMRNETLLQNVSDDDLLAFWRVIDTLIENARSLASADAPQPDSDD